MASTAGASLDLSEPANRVPVTPAGSDSLCAKVESEAKRELAAALASVEEIVYDRPPCYRWLILAFYTFLAWFAGPLYFNWPPLDEIFHWNNAFAERCVAGVSADFELRPHGEIYCLEKKIQIESLGTLAVSVLFIFNFVGGVVLDTAGAKVACAVGLTLQILGWILVAVSSATVNAWRVGIFFIASGTDPFFFGLISVYNLFPNWSSTVIALLGAARSAAFVNGIILRGIISSRSPRISLRPVAFGYAAVLLVLFAICMYVVPSQPFPQIDEATIQMGTKKAGLAADAGAEAEGKVEDTGRGGRSITNGALPDVPATETGVSYVSHRAVAGRRPQFDLKSLLAHFASQYRTLRAYACQWTYVCIVLIAMAALLRSNYYSATYKKHLANTVDFYEVMSPLSLIPCPFFGIFADRVSASLLLSFLAACAAATLAFVLATAKWAQVVSIMFNWLCASFLASQFYCACNFFYPLHVYGTLTGVVMIVAGCFALVATPLNDFASRHDRYLPFDLLLIAALAVCAAAAFCLHIFVERPMRREKKREARLAKQKDIAEREREADGAADGAAQAEK